MRIPTDASPQLREALLEAERRFLKLESAREWVPTKADFDKLRADLDEVLKTRPTHADLDTEWLEMVPAGPLHSHGYVPDPTPYPGFGHERALHEDGTWGRVLGG